MAGFQIVSPIGRNLVEPSETVNVMRSEERCDSNHEIRNFRPAVACSRRAHIFVKVNDLLIERWCVLKATPRSGRMRGWT
jgi:hypothetical protein